MKRIPKSITLQASRDDSLETLDRHLRASLTQGASIKWNGRGHYITPHVVWSGCMMYWQQPSHFRMYCQNHLRKCGLGRPNFAVEEFCKGKYLQNRIPWNKRLSISAPNKICIPCSSRSHLPCASLHPWCHWFCSQLWACAASLHDFPSPHTAWLGQL